jgi:hypothetical protein
MTSTVDRRQAGDCRRPRRVVTSLLLLLLSTSCVVIGEKRGDCWRYFGEALRHGDYGWTDCEGKAVTAKTQPVSKGLVGLGLGLGAFGLAGGAVGSGIGFLDEIVSEFVTGNSLPVEEVVEGVTDG